MNGRPRLSWEDTAMNLAFNIAEFRSEDPYVQVGSCIIKHDKSILVGYNGAPTGLDLDWKNRDERRDWVFHAEANVLNRVLPNETYILAATHIPCGECLKIIKQKEINTVYYSIESPQYDPIKVKKLAIKYQINLIRHSYGTTNTTNRVD